MTTSDLDTMKSGATAPATTDKFSWRRVGEVAKYYSPVINRQLAVYGIISVTCAIILLLPLNATAWTGIFSLTYTMLPLLFWLAPIAFAKHGDTRIVCRMLPAKASEKYAFFLIYNLVVIPITLYMLPEFALWLNTVIPEIRSDMALILIELHFTNYTILTIINTLCSVSTVITCLYVLNYARHSRIIKAVASVFGVQFVAGVLGALFGLSIAFQRGYEDGVNGTIMTEEQQNMLVKEMIERIATSSPYIITLTTIFAIYLVVMLWLTYVTLRKRNL